jgi:hypothetical protein
LPVPPLLAAAAQRNAGGVAALSRLQQPTHFIARGSGLESIRSATDGADSKRIFTCRRL